MFRQGDVLIVPSRKKNLGEEQKSNGKVVLALGEMTGHHHRFEDQNVKLFKDDGVFGGRTFVKLDDPASLIHEEHSTIKVPKGVYEQAFQVEYTPKELRRVAD